MLMRLWQFEDSLDEPALLELLSGSFSKEAKELLSYLWQNKLLTSKTRRLLGE